ncbi:MAG: 30S ribosomal protein S20 [Clostridia bacterium]|nr:30S ribosomal protein S20 [Clostridia bacterium]
MPNIKSAEKRVKVIATKTLQNQMIKSNLKTTLKTFEAACDKEDKAGLAEIFQNTVKTIDMACTKGVLKKNTASRKKSNVAKKYNAAIKG